MPLTLTSGFAVICLALLGVIENNKLQTTTDREANSLLTPETKEAATRNTIEPIMLIEGDESICAQLNRVYGPERSSGKMKKSPLVVLEGELRAKMR